MRKTIVIENSGIRLTINQNTGGIISIQNKIKRLILCKTNGKVPWRLQIESPEGSKWIDEYEKFEYEKKEDKIFLKWITKLDILVEAVIEAPKEEKDIYFYIKVKNYGFNAILAVEYPIIEGIRALGKKGRTCLVHPIATGYVFYDPTDLFEPGVRRRWHEDMFKYGLYHSFYPDGFLGACMQFLGYYIEGKGGFYIASHDPYKTAKYINFYRDSDAPQLTCSFMHLAWDIKSGNSLLLEYPVVISPLCEGSWFEAAEKYKSWAKNQEWCKEGPLWERVKKERASKWLLEDIGFCTFGISSAIDQAEWYDAFHRITGKPVFHITAWDWAGSNDKNYGNKESWFPAFFNKRNLEVIRRNGDYFAPFEFDLFYNMRRPEWEEVKKFAIVPSKNQLKVKAERIIKMIETGAVKADITEKMKNIVEKIKEILNKPMIEFPEELVWFLSPFNMFYKNMCPVTKFWQELHVWRDKKVVEEYGADALYYDISANNGEGGEIGGPTSCFSDKHSHPRGYGRWIIDAYRELYKLTKDAATKVKGRYVPLGTEVITEVFIDRVDFYQARAEAGPCGAFEGEPFKKWEIEGRCEKIPLFAYVYHEYGPIRLDGFAKISKEFGDIFYWIAARVTLWGGIFELNYEYSPLEKFPGMTGPSGYIKYTGEWYIENKPYEVDQEKISFLKEIVAARTGFAKEYLAYGQMVKPLTIESPHICLKYTCLNDPSGKLESGTLITKSIIHSAWMFRRERLGLLFVNLKDQEIYINVKIQPERYGLAAKSGYELHYVTSEERKKIGFFRKRAQKKIKLPSKKIVLIEIKPL